MQKSTLITVAEYGIGIGISVAIHLTILHTAHASPQAPEIQLDTGTASVELTLLPSITSEATPPPPAAVAPSPPPPPIPQQAPATEAPLVEEADLPASDPQDAQPLTEEPPKPPLEAPPETIQEPVETPVEEAQPLEEIPEPAPPERPAEEMPAPENESTVNAQEQAGSPDLDKGLITKAIPTLTFNTSKYYPRSLRFRGIEGTVLLAITISRTGHPVQVKIVQSSGYKLFDQAAIKLINDSRFTPAKQYGRPIQTTHRIPIPFRLK